MAAQPNSLVSRMMRAARLESALYEEVEADTSALGQAMLVVVLSSVAAGIGLGLGSLLSGDVGGLALSLVVGTAAALASWFVWALLTYLIGTTILRGPETSSNLGELLRTIGFSTSPGVLRIFAFVPILGPIIVLAVSLWMLVAMVIAVRQALDFDTWRAVGTTLLGFVVQLVVFVVLIVLAGPTT